MSSVDNRVVQMTFDNAKFEKNAATTLSTLDKLKKSLDFSGATKGLETLSIHAKSFSMEAVAAGVETVSEKFGALEVVGIRVLQRITDMAFDTGRQLISALTIDPIKSGLQEYETQINAVQTILANTRDSLVHDEGLTSESDQIARINGVLDDLNHYADMTIYNFTEMTRNIGTFTAAGVQLDKAQNAIKGIANLAAVSGSNSEQASRAMYQLSQALASGTVHLQDWNSVVTAGMGGEVFQKAIKETARVHGIAIDEMEKSAGSFRALLTEKDYGNWLNADILLESLEKFTAGSEGYTHEQIEQQKKLWKARGYSSKQIQDLTSNMKELTQTEYDNIRAVWSSRGYTEEQIDEIFALGNSATDAATKVKTFSQLLETVGEALQSGWTQSWEYIVGDFAEAKALWTEISDIMQLYIGQSAEARNNELKLWSMGEVDEKGNRLTEGLTGREMVIQGIRNAFQGVYEIIGYINQAWEKSFLHKGKNDDLSITGKKLIDLSKKFLDFTQKFKDMIVEGGKVTDFTKSLYYGFSNVFKSIRKVYDGLINLIKVFSGSMLKQGFSSFFEQFEVFQSDGTLIDYLDDVSTRFKDFIEVLSNKIFTDSAVVSFFDGLAKAAKALFEIKMDVALSAWDAFSRIMGHATDDWSGVAGLISGIGDSLGEFSDNVLKLIYNENGASRFNDVFQEVADNIINFIDNVNGSGALNPNFFDDWTKDLYDLMNKEPNKFFDILKNALEGVANICETLYAVFEPLVEAFFETFKLSEFIDVLSDIIGKFKTFTEAIELNGDNMVGLKKFYKGVFDVIKAFGSLLKDISDALFDTFGNIFKAILPDKQKFTDILGDIGDSLSEFANKLSNLFNTSSNSNGMESLFQTIGDSIVKFIDKAKQLLDVPGLIQQFLTWLDGLDFSNVTKGFDDFSKGVSGTKESGEEAAESVSIWEAIGNAIKSVLELFQDVFTKIDVAGILGSIAAVMTGKGFLSIGKFLKDLPETLKGIRENGNLFPTILSNITDTLEEMQNTLKVSRIVALGGAIAAIAFGIAELSKNPPENILAALGALSAGVAALIGVMNLMLKRIKKDDVQNLSWELVGLTFAFGSVIDSIAKAIVKIAALDPGQVAASVIAISSLLYALVKFYDGLSKIEDIKDIGMNLTILTIGIRILVSSVKSLGKMNPEQMAQGLLGFGIVLGIIVKAFKSLPQNDSIIDTSKALVIFGIGMNVMAIAVKKFASMNLEQLAIGIAGFAITLAMMVKTFKEMPQNDSIMDASKALIVFGIGMNVMAIAVKKFASMDLGQLIIGLLGFGLTLAMMVETFDQMPSNESMMDTSKALIVFGIGMNVMAIAVKKFASMNLEQLAIGIAGFAITLAMMVKTFKEMPQNDSLMKTAAALIVFGIGMNVIALAVKQFASLNLDQLMIGLAGFAVSLFLVAEVAGSMPDNLAKIGAGLIVFSIGLVVLGSALKIFGSMRLDELIIAIVGLGVTLGLLSEVVGSFSNQMQGALVMMAVGVACTLLGAGMFLLGKLGIGGLIIALVALAGALVIFGYAAQALTPAIPQMFALAGALALMGIGLAAITWSLSHFATMLVTLGAQGVAAIAALLDGLIALMPKFGEFLTILFNTLLQVIIDVVPKLIEAIFAIAEVRAAMAISRLVGFAKLIIDAIMQICELIGPYIPQLVQMASQMAVDFINGLTANMPALSESGVNWIIALLAGITFGLPGIIAAAFTVFLTFINGLADTIRNEKQTIWDTIGNLISALFEAIIGGVEWFLKGAGKLISGFLGEFDAGKLMKDLLNAGANLVNGIVNGIGQAARSLFDAAANLARGALDRITHVFDENSPSKEGMKRGAYLGEGVAIGIENSYDDVVNNSEALAYGALDAMSKMDETSYTPSISPVFNMSDIQNGINQMNSMFSSMPSTASIQGDLKASAQLKSDITNALTNSADYSSIISSMMGIRSDLSDYAYQMANQRIVMDSGALVGQLTPGIDRGIGRTAILTGRGVL